MGCLAQTPQFHSNSVIEVLKYSRVSFLCGRINCLSLVLFGYEAHLQSYYSVTAHICRSTDMIADRNVFPPSSPHSTLFARTVNQALGGKATMIRGKGVESWISVHRFCLNQQSENQQKSDFHRQSSYLFKSVSMF